MRAEGGSVRMGGWLVWLLLLGGISLASPPTQAAAAEGVSASGLGYSLTPSTTEPYAECPQPTPGHPECMSLVVPPAAVRSRASLSALPEQAFSPAVVTLEGSGEDGGLAPSDLLSAYRLPTSAGSGQTVAIVDAYDDPHAEADLKVYRSHYGLSECTTANGCFEKVNQSGKAEKYPAAEPEWSGEISLDLDMVSAICANCHILLVEANNPEGLFAAEDEAASFGATTEISDSWGEPETPEEGSSDSHFNHGIPIAVASGDSGYSTCELGSHNICYPAASKYAISVGGTTFIQDVLQRTWMVRGSVERHRERLQQI